MTWPYSAVESIKKKWLEETVAFVVIHIPIQRLGKMRWEENFTQESLPENTLQEA